MHTSSDLRGQTVLALHAHPDDEAIFTGITLRRLAEAGARIVLVLATAGELGESLVSLNQGESLATRRVRELEQSAALLGVSRLLLLGRRDSGLSGSSTGAHPMALAGADPMMLARRIADLALTENAATLIHDDDEGIYGHPDHRAAHRVGKLAADLVGATSYRTTVNREVLTGPAADEHLVQGAAEAASVVFGRPASDITLTITGDDDHLAAKYAAMTAHASQIRPGDVPEDRFADVYGTEWFRGSGAPGLLDLLGAPTGEVARLAYA
ncbi:MAG TPA: PIG-L family deacetylase [Pseudonocardia sp.]|jgi:LmbE family N-acetylglucosaminyl deacetylase|nr:PIG-L family deacetylase [Pseudonocardia sp.]